MTNNTSSNNSGFLSSASSASSIPPNAFSRPVIGSSKPRDKFHAMFQNMRDLSQTDENAAVNICGEHM